MCRRAMRPLLHLLFLQRKNVWHELHLSTTSGAIYGSALIENYGFNKNQTSF